MEKIKEGQIFKNMRELCEATGQEYKDGTNSGKALKKKFDLLFKWHKDGRKIVIDEVYEEIKEKTEKRGKSQGSRGNYKGIYANYIDNMILQYLQEGSGSKCETILTTNIEIADKTGIVNHNYVTAYNNRGKFYNTVRTEFNIVNNTYCMYDTFDFIKSKINDTVSSSLDRLQKSEYIKYKSCYIINEVSLKRVATEEEITSIISAENQTYSEMNITELQRYNNHSISEKFNKKSLEKVIGNLGYIISYYKGYSIDLKKCITFTDDEVTEFKRELNKRIIKSLKQKPKKKQIKEKNRRDKAFGFCSKGERKIYLQQWLHDVFSEMYVEYCCKFIDILCDIEAKNIVKEIKDCENTKIIR